MNPARPPGVTPVTGTDATAPPATGTGNAGVPVTATVSAEAKARTVEIVISTLLRVGVVTSVAIVLAGLIVAFVHHPAYRTSSSLRHAVVDGRIPFPHSFGAIVSGLAAGQGQAIVVLGLVLLLLTPVARVAVSIFTFVYQRDRIYVAVTTLVLFVLILSFLLGKASSG